MFPEQTPDPGPPHWALQEAGVQVGALQETWRGGLPLQEQITYPPQGFPVGSSSQLPPALQLQLTLLPSVQEVPAQQLATASWLGRDNVTTNATSKSSLIHFIPTSFSLWVLPRHHTADMPDQIGQSQWPQTQVHWYETPSSPRHDLLLPLGEQEVLLTAVQ